MSSRVLVQTWLLLLLLIAGALVVLVEARHDAQTRGRDRALLAARTVAASPLVAAAAGTPDPQGRLQPFAEQVRRAGEFDYVSVLSPEGVIWTHPNPAAVGQRYAGTIEPAVDGEVLTEKSSDPADPALRAVAPVMDGDGEVVALVAVGTSSESLGKEALRRLPLLLALVVLAAALAYGGPELARRRDGHGSARSRARATEA